MVLFVTIYLLNLLFTKQQKRLYKWILEPRTYTGKVLTKISHPFRSYTSIYSTTFAVKPMLKNLTSLWVSKEKRRSKDYVRISKRTPW